MKNVILGLVAALIATVSVHADVLAGWNFDSLTVSFTAGASPVPTAGSLSADVGSGLASAFHASTATVWSTPAGNFSAKSLSANTWSVGDYYQFRVSTTGFQSINVSWDQTGSNTGPRDFALYYSTDGTSFTLYSTVTAVTNDSWSASGPFKTASTRAFDLSSVTSINNAATVYFRIQDASTTSISAGVVATGGTDRIDNFTVSGTLAAVPEPHEYGIAFAAMLAVLVVIRRRKTVTMA